LADLNVSGSHPYLRLKLAQELFQKAPDKLAPEEQQRVEAVVERQLKIEQRILATPEAAQVILPASSVEQSLAEIRQRYLTEEEFLADLGNSGLDPESLSIAIRRDLTVDAVLDRIASRIAEVTDTDVEIFYLMHRHRFQRPEFRHLRHILLTINETLPGSDRLTALTRIEGIRARLFKSPERFAEQALKHSECPTAMNGGLLGAVKRGQLFPELEPEAFALGAGELSEVLESPLGFHLIGCVSIEEARDLPLSEVREKIRLQLVDSRRRAAQKAWIAGLLRQEC
jgi:nitrogen fixation protein NifM